MSTLNNTPPRPTPTSFGQGPFSSAARPFSVHENLGSGFFHTKRRRPLFLCSIGTGSLRPKYTAGELGRINFLGGALRALRSLMEANILEQDRLCRTLGHCLHGAPIDREFGAMLGEGRGLFTYCRYQHEFTEAEIEACRRETGSTKPFELDNLTGVPALLEIGKRIAAEQVAAEHLV